jgi:hypothetical protein
VSAAHSADNDALTEEQVYALPEGEPITVTWSGGNGPHPYVLLFHQAEPHACAEGDEGNPRMRYYNPLTFIWQGRYHTRVWTRVIPPASTEVTP